MKFTKIFTVKRISFEAEIGVVRDASILKLFKKVVNQNLHAHFFRAKRILYLLNFEFDRNAIETQNIFIDVSICLFHFSTKHDVLQQMFVQFKNFNVHLILIVVGSETDYFESNFAN